MGSAGDFMDPTPAKLHYVSPAGGGWKGLLWSQGAHAHTIANERNAAQKVRFLVSWIVKQGARSTPVGAFLQHRTQACNIREP